MDECIKVDIWYITRVARPQDVGRGEADLLEDLGLDFKQVLGIVAQYSGHGHLPDLLKLF